LLGACAAADVGIGVVDSPDPTYRTGELTYTLTAQNYGPTTAAGVTVTDTLPANTTFRSVSAPNGWTCTSPAVGAAGTVTCSVDSLAVGSATITLKVIVSSSAPASGTIQNQAAVSATTSDPSDTNNIGTATTSIAASSQCSPRPPVRVLVEPAGPDALRVTVSTTGSGNRLVQLFATIPDSARVDIRNGPSNLTGQQSLGVGTGAQAVFVVRRVGEGAVTIPLEVVDTCGTWKTVVGQGTGSS
jgi:uncharacterized repeat protein (TIGR01451 family)